MNFEHRFEIVIYDHTQDYTCDDCEKEPVLWNVFIEVDYWGLEIDVDVCSEGLSPFR